ncbi:hypothetical protein LI328DRAFT_170324 [Trichoderma asperelloides]|nr:hypothetical protein LI328DRAFT_170324 [Trichoderma asperelloides]
MIAWQSLTTVVGQVSSAPYRLRQTRLKYGWRAILRKHGNGNEESARGENAPPTPFYSLPPSAAERDSQPAGVNAPSPRITTDMGPAVWLANSLEGVRESDSRRLTDPVAWPNLQGYPTVARRHWQS